MQRVKIGQNAPNLALGGDQFECNQGAEHEKLGRFRNTASTSKYLILSTNFAWRISNTLDADCCVDALHDASHKFGAPEIMNTGQGSQFTSFDWTVHLKRVGSRISMPLGVCNANTCRYQTAKVAAWTTSSSNASGAHGCVYLHALGGRVAGKERHRALDHFLQPLTPSHCPWRSTACRGLL